MRVLYLGSDSASLASILTDCQVLATEEILDVYEISRFAPDLILSFGYRHKVGAEILSLPRIAALNVHISLLPWNGGADPNLWSWLTNTPKGISIHWMTQAIDQGDLAFQKKVPLDAHDSLRETYSQLQNQALAAVNSLWPSIVVGEVPRIAMPEGGSYHRSRDKDPHLASLTQGWDTSCEEVMEYGRQQGLWVGKGRAER